MAEQISPSTGITIIAPDGSEDLPPELYFDDGAQQSQIDHEYARRRGLRIRYLNQHVGMANGTLCQVGELVDPIMLMICYGTKHET